MPGGRYAKGGCRWSPTRHGAARWGPHPRWAFDAAAAAAEETFVEEEAEEGWGKEEAVLRWLLWLLRLWLRLRLWCGGLWDGLVVWWRSSWPVALLEEAEVEVGAEVEAEVVAASCGCWPTWDVSRWRRVSPADDDG